MTNEEVILDEIFEYMKTGQAFYVTQTPLNKNPAFKQNWKYYYDAALASNLAKEQGGYGDFLGLLLTDEGISLLRNRKYSAYVAEAIAKNKRENEKEDLELQIKRLDFRSKKYWLRRLLIAALIGAVIGAMITYVVGKLKI